MMRGHKTVRHDDGTRREAYDRSSKRWCPTGEQRRGAHSHGGGTSEGDRVRGADGTGGDGAHDAPGQRVADQRALSSRPTHQPAPRRTERGHSTGGGNGPVTPSDDYNRRLEADLVALLEYSRRSLGAPVERQGGTIEAPGEVHEEQEYTYKTVSTTIRAHYERLQDNQRATPMTLPSRRRRNMHTKRGQFNSSRLRALENYLLTANGPGMSEAGMDNFFKFMKKWEKPRKGGRRRKRVDEIFKTTNALKTAVNADLDAAISDEGWQQCEFEEGGVHYEAYFLPVLDVMLKLVREAEDVKFWSGTDGPAGSTEMRETAMDGDVFRLFEKDVCSNGADKFVLGFYVYSDSHVLSGSGGTRCLLLFFPRGRS